MVFFPGFFLSNLKELINQDFGFISVPLELEHKEVVIGKFNG